MTNNNSRFGQFDGTNYVCSFGSSESIFLRSTNKIIAAAIIIIYLDMDSATIP